MRRNTRWTWIALLAVLVILFGNVHDARSATAGAADTGGTVGNLEKITFEKLKGKERVTLMVSKPSGFNVDSAAGNAVLVKLENMLVPENLRKPAGVGKLANIIRVLPVQKTANGAQWAMITIDLKQQVPYSVSQRGSSVLIDFNTTTLENNNPYAKRVSSVGTDVGRNPTATSYTGRIISLDFQDASIKAVLRLLAEEGGVTIVSGDDVKGNVTAHMNKVPWDQALDTILNINGLTQKRTGNIITVMTLEKKKKDEADRRQGEEERVKAEAAAKKAEQERSEERGRLAQISIEAKIVEATDDFYRQIGVQWGGAVYGRVNDYGASTVGGTNPYAGPRGRPTNWAYPSQVGIAETTATAMATNFPTALAQPTIGIVIGGANAVLEAQLSALENTAQGKIISSPKITTMDNVKATIKQGQEIPYTVIDKDGNRSVTFKEAVLRLEVKPKITPEGKISMEIKAMNDSADYARAVGLEGNPPINKSEVESKVVVEDGDTVVIGGILKTEDSKGSDGVPWLSKIPVLGWLFKTESTTRNRRQLMVFVTPKIIKSDAGGEIPRPPLQPQPQI